VSTVRWLQISDIHFRSIDNWRHIQERKSLIAQIKSEKANGKFDLIFCTGDIAFGETSANRLVEQYEDAKVFFLELLNACEITSEKLFIVPGNHDVNRHATDLFSRRGMRDAANNSRQFEREISEEIVHKRQGYKNALTRLSAFRDFAKDLCPHLHTDEHLHYRHRINVNGLSIDIVGFNSAWSCDGTEIERGIVSGIDAQLLGNQDKADLQIGLIHHPCDWLCDADRELLEGRMGVSVDILLHGHTHVFKSRALQCGFPIFGTGAVTATDNVEYGFTVYDFNVNKGAVNALFFEYDRTRVTWEAKTNRQEEWVLPKQWHRPVSESSDQRTYSDFFVRPARSAFADDYIDLVEPGSSARIRDNKFFQRLWSDSMGDHTVFELAGDPDELHFAGDNDTDRIVEKDNLDAYFLRSVYKPNEVFVSATPSSSIQDVRDQTVSLDYFKQDVTSPPQRTISLKKTAASLRSENRVRYLLGPAGIGKSLAVLKIIDEIRQTKVQDSVNKSLPVYVDLHQDNNWLTETAADAVNLAICRVAKSILSQLPIGVSSLEPKDFEGSLNADVVHERFRQLADEYLRGGFTPFIVFDNGDKFFFQDAKFRLFPEYAQKQDWHLQETLVALVNRFVVKTNLGNIGACVLFVVRKYVHRHCSGLADEADPEKRNRVGHTPYQLIPAKENDVIGSRFQLLDQAVLAILGKYRNAEAFLGAVANIGARLRGIEVSPNHPLATIFELVPQGHRSMINFLGGLPVDIGSVDGSVFERVLGSRGMLLRLFISDMRKKYSQKFSKFPNLFLVDAVVDSSDSFPVAKKPHVHTYWLKYLLLKYCHKLQEQNDHHRINSEEVVTFFSEKLGYELSLVRLALGSLSDPSNAACFTIAHPDLLRRYIEDLELNSRGKRLVIEQLNDSPLCFSFDYLQMITDDFMLALPKSISKKVSVKANLAHSLKPGEQYSKGARDTLNAKIPAVLWFFRVLELTFENEAVFRGNKSKLLDLGLVPDFVQLRASLFRTINRVDSAFDVTHVSNSLPDPSKIWKEVVGFNELGEQIENYYAQPVLVSV
jgi:predicted MPP superfamily phosphohydrolase